MAKWLSISLLVILLDQVTKYIANTGLAYADAVPVVPSFNLTLMYNRGAAFSFLSDAAGWQRWFFVAISLGASVLLIAWLRKLEPQQWLLGVALALVLGGAIGNLIDRLWLGYVIDFIQLYYKSFYWPAFNVADSAISVGAVLLVWEALFARSKDDA